MLPGESTKRPRTGRPQVETASPHRRRRLQGGFNLIEVLISVLVLLVGTLGVVGMQMLSLQANQGAYHRSQAVYIAAEILDAMRANPSGAAAYVNVYDAGGATIPADPGCQGSLGCTPAQAAAQDLHFWGRHFADVGELAGPTYRPSIPGGRAEIRSPGANEYEVEITWIERRFDNSGARDNRRSSVVLRTVIAP